MRSGVESAQVAHLGVALGAGGVVGRLGCAADVELRLTQGAVDFGRLGLHRLGNRLLSGRLLLLLLLL